MPLYIDGKLLNSSKNLHPSQIYKAYPELCQRSREFTRDSENIILNKSDRILYVYQDEIASISPMVNKQNLNYICTDEATTCHIVVLIEKSSSAISLGHFGGKGTGNGLKKMIHELSEIFKISNNSVAKPEFNLYLFGGFIDEKGHSEKLFIELLSCCTKLNDSVTLQLACCYSLNDIIVNDKHTPDIYGIVVNIKTCDISRGNCMYRDPDYILRHVRLHSSESILQLYDYEAQVVYIAPFVFHSMSYVNYLLRLTDEEYLEICSTSPHCEPADFVENSKKALLFRTKWENRISEIFCGRRREHLLNDCGEWVLVDPEQVVLS